MRLVSLSTLALLAASPAAADIIDVSAAIEADSTHILIRFDAQPTLAAATLIPGGVRVMTRGAAGEAQAIIPPENSPVALLEITPSGELKIALRRSATAANVEIFENALLVTATLGGAAAVAGAISAPSDLTMDPIPDPGGSKAPAIPSGAMDIPGTGETPESVSEAAEAEETPATEAEEPQRAAAGPASSLFAARLDEAACMAAASAVEADAWALQASLRLAACQARDGDAQGAQEIYERVLTFDPYNAEAEAGLGALAQDAGDMALARARYESALDMSPGDGLAILVRQLMGTL